MWWRVVCELDALHVAPTGGAGHPVPFDVGARCVEVPDVEQRGRARVAGWLRSRSAAAFVHWLRRHLVVDKVLDVHEKGFWFNSW